MPSELDFGWEGEPFVRFTVDGFDTSLIGFP